MSQKTTGEYVVEFETIQLDECGQIVSHPQGHARQFTAILGATPLELVAIPAGTFVMGSSPGQGYVDEHPQRRVRVAAFWMSKYPITQAQWQALMGAHTGRFQGAQLPVENISWVDANKFVRRLSRQTGRHYGLPSEAQWEYACRAGTSTSFAFGPTLTTDVANYNGQFAFGRGRAGSYRHETTKVDAFPPNAFGVCDLHGNVWEWCADTWHESYRAAPDDGRAWQQGGESGWRVTRGGSWHDTPDVCRSAARLRVNEREGDEFTGFRVVLS